MSRRLVLICLWVASCALAKDTQSPVLSAMMRGQILPEQTLQAAISHDGKNATLYHLLDAYAILRRGDLNDAQQVSRAKDGLAQAVASFEDLRDPDNFSTAFSVDEKTLYRGRPHERVMAALMLGALDMAQGRCDMAMPSLRNAEFLDARWQAVPYGSDAPLVYALMLRCAHQMGLAATDISRAKEGLSRSLRLLIVAEPLQQALQSVWQLNLQRDSLAMRVAHFLLEASLASSLVRAPSDANLAKILEEASRNAEELASVLETKFDKEDTEIFGKMAAEIAKVEGGMSADDVQKAAFSQLPDALRRLSFMLTIVLKRDKYLHGALVDAFEKAATIAAKSEFAALASKMVVVFSGKGPSLVREGEYEEVARIVPSKEGSVHPVPRQKWMQVTGHCGLSRGEGDSLVLTLCKTSLPQASFTQAASALELYSSSFQATSMLGRRFDQVLKGRAHFRKTTENIAVVGGAVALGLLAASAGAYSNCLAQGYSEAQCSQQSAALAGAGAVAGAIAGISYLVGRSVNPAADWRYVPLLYESAYVLIPQGEGQ